jgi:hypothetical protein
MTEAMRLDEKGLPAYDWLEGLTPAEFEDWIGGRLAGADPLLPFRDSDEARGEVFLHICARLALRNPVAVRIGAAVTRLTEEVVAQTEPDPIVFASTLSLYGGLPSTSLTRTIRSAVSGPSFKSKPWQAHDLDIYLLVALSQKASGLTRAFWEPLLDDVRTFEVALVAVQTGFGWDEALDLLLKQVRVFLAHPDQTDLALALDYIMRDATSQKLVLDAVRDAKLDASDRAALKAALTEIKLGRGQGT